MVAEATGRGRLPISHLMSTENNIVVHGARVHNLKNIDFEVEHNALTVVDGSVGIGEIFARVRHNLCGGAAAVCGVAVGVCAAVFGTD